jgi:membrane-associated protease RseP (regulator of RpoE activity)
MSDMYRPRPAGVIGTQLFQAMASRFDFDSRRLTLLLGDHQRIEAPPPAWRLPLINEEHGRMLSVTLDTGVIDRTTFEIDSGSPMTEIPAAPPLKSEPLSVWPETVTDQGGAADVRDELVESISLGTSVVQHPVLTVRPGAKFTLLGSGILSRFKVTIDPQYGDFIIEPRRFVDRRRPGDTGIGGHLDGDKLIVDRVVTVVAERAGVRVGDEVVSVDGCSGADVAAGKISKWQYNWRTNGCEGAVARIVIRRDGVEKTLDDFRTGFPDIVPKLLGMNLLKSAGKSARVFELEPGAAADAAGIKLDDEITAVNGVPALDWTAYKMILETLDNSGNPITPLRLQIKRKADGKTIEMQVKGGKLEPVV